MGGSFVCGAVKPTWRFWRSFFNSHAPAMWRVADLQPLSLALPRHPLAAGHLACGCETVSSRRSTGDLPPWPIRSSQNPLPINRHVSRAPHPPRPRIGPRARDLLSPSWGEVWVPSSHQKSRRPTGRTTARTGQGLPILQRLRWLPRAIHRTQDRRPLVMPQVRNRLQMPQPAVTPRPSRRSMLQRAFVWSLCCSLLRRAFAPKRKWTMAVKIPRQMPNRPYDRLLA